GLDGIWYAFPICDIGSFIFTMYLLRRELKRLKSLDKLSTAENTEDAEMQIGSHEGTKDTKI
ncbi:MAG: hypothetical protein LBL39_03220, partial [Planctomycetaceae bacterium]|nr:hypothetical protein [Planctomycetaceae bacterium]